MIGTPPSAVGREPGEDVRRSPAGQRRRGAVLGTSAPRPRSADAHDLGDAALLREGEGISHRRTISRATVRQPGQIGLAHPPSGAGSRSWLRPRARAERRRGADELAEERLRAGRAGS